MTTMAPATEPAIVRDAKALGLEALGGIRSAIDNAFGKTEAAVPQLVGDAASFANTWLDGHVGTPSTRMYLKSALGLVETTVLPTLDRIAVAGLVDLNHVIDARIGAFTGTASTTGT